MAARLLSPAEGQTTSALTVLLHAGLALSQSLTLRAVDAIMASRYSRARELRAYLAAHQAGPLPLSTVLRAPCTPTWIMSLVDDLRHEGLLTRAESTAIEEHLLSCIDSHGHWR